MVSWRPSESVPLASPPGVFALFGLLSAAVLFKVMFIVGTDSVSGVGTGGRTKSSSAVTVF